VPVTEYVMVYRKRSDRLIDWYIRNHPDQFAVEMSKVSGDYETTNVWRICPSSSPVHPAVFPLELAERVVRYYSFKNDLILDPLAGIGTVGTAALNLDRRFYLIEKRRRYVDHFLATERRRFPKSGRRPAPANRSSART
jgi:DNA modification methylase